MSSIRCSYTGRLVYQKTKINVFAMVKHNFGFAVQNRNKQFDKHKTNNREVYVNTEKYAKFPKCMPKNSVIFNIWVLSTAKQICILLL